MTKNDRLVAALLVSASVQAGCANAHEAPGPVTVASADLACSPDQLRSSWWSEGGATVLGGSVGLPMNAARTHMLVSDLFRPIALRLADGARSPDGSPMSALADLGGVLFVTQELTVDAGGHNDLAGATEIFAIGTASPLARIPWIVPRDGAGYSQVVAHISETTGRVTLLEHATRFGGADAGLWLRAFFVAHPEAERRVDLRASIPNVPERFDAPFTLVVDEPRDVAFVITGEQADGAPSVTRVDIATGATATVTLVMGEPAPLRGLAHVGEPPASLLDVALAADGSILILTGRDGSLRVLDADTLEEAGPRIEVAVQVANEDSYLPSVRSPVAFSGQGHFIALLDPSGEIAILDRETMLPVATLHSAAPPPVAGHTWGFEAREMSMRFVPDGLIVVSDAGIERFRCPG